MTLRVVWRAEARLDLLELYDWIAQQAGATTAINYTLAIEQHVNKLCDLPGWGSPRDDLAAGMRTISYRRRTTIAYRELDDAVEIVRLAHGGRDLGRTFRKADD